MLERFRPRSLFRSEVNQHKARTDLTGDVQLSSNVTMGRCIAALVAMTIGAAIFVALARYDRVVRVTGVLEPSLGIIAVPAERLGFISDVFVTEGQEIGAGQALLRMSYAQAPSGDLHSAETEIELVSESIAEIERRVALETERLEHYTARYHAEARRLDREEAHLVTRLRHQSELVEVAADMAELQSSLWERGLASEQNVQSARLTLAAQRRDEVELTDTLQGLSHARELSHQALTEDRFSSLERRSSLVSEKMRLQREYARLLEAQGRVVTSPVAGVVAALQVQRGQALTPGEVFLSLRPSGSRLVAEMRLPTEAAGFVRPGLPVRLRFRAFPAERYGVFKGEVLQVAGSTTSDGGPSSATSYRMVVELNLGDITERAPEIRLLPGMALDGAIVLESRPLYDWVVGPVRRIWSAF